jgi:hypothetical protein
LKELIINFQDVCELRHENFRAETEDVALELNTMKNRMKARICDLKGAPNQNTRMSCRKVGTFVALPNGMLPADNLSPYAKHC